jgi:glucan phosphorylase
VRIVVSGKAHPRDKLGQDILKSIVQIARSPDFLGKVICRRGLRHRRSARALVQGVDVWVNTPTRMEEASGTSGMKAAANGVLNLSIADGWWPEAADGGNGWTIGGHSKDGGELRNPVQVSLQAEGALDGKLQAYVGTYRIQRSGNFAYGLRVRIRPLEGLDDGTGDLVRWA